MTVEIRGRVVRWRLWAARLLLRLGIIRIPDQVVVASVGDREIGRRRWRLTAALTLEER